MGASLTLSELACMFHNTSVRNVLNSDITSFYVWKIPPVNWDGCYFPFLLFAAQWRAEGERDNELYEHMMEYGRAAGEKTHGLIAPHGCYRKLLWHGELRRLTRVHRLSQQRRQSPDFQKITLPANGEGGKRGWPTVRINWRALGKHWVWYLLVSLGDC